MHGSIYLSLKTEDDFRKKLTSWTTNSWIIFILLYVIATFFSLFEAPFLFEGILRNPLFWILFILLLVSVLYQPVAVKAGKYFIAFISSSLTIASMIGLVALSLFPRLVPSNIDLDFSLTIYNASSSQNTLTAMLIIALVGMPIVIAYTIFIYRVFKGKTVISKESY
jgi:cytochrome d ubiquinol oxidase subunit II